MSTSESDAEERARLKRDLPVIVDQAFFQHYTGDTYDGTFEAKKKDRSIKMNGPGIYSTADGDVYLGNWRNDILVDEVTISYASGSKYEGLLRDWAYSGKGKYTYPDSTVLSCNFHDNCPVGDLELTDPNGRIWLAKAAPGFAWFAPTNHYYDMLDKRFSDATLRRRKLKKDPSSLKMASPSDKKKKHRKSSPKTSPKTSPKIISPTQKEASPKNESIASKTQKKK